MVDRQPTTTERQPFLGVIRRFRPADVRVLRPIISTWIKDRKTGDPLPEEVEEDLQTMVDSVAGKTGRMYLVAEDIEKGVIGVIGMKLPNEKMMAFAKTPKPAELINAYVAKDERKGKGVGSELVKNLELIAHGLGFTEILLNSGPRYEETGWGFYDKLPGYERVGVAEKYYGDGGDAPVWRKEL